MCCAVLVTQRTEEVTAALPETLSCFSFFSKFLHVSYFYLRTETHEAIADCEIDLVSCTTGLYFPHSSTFLIRSHMPWGARETLWLDLSVVHCPFVPKGLEF